MTDYEALKVLDKIPREANIYRMIVELSERAHQLDRNKLDFRKNDPLAEVFKEVQEKPVSPEE